MLRLKSGCWSGSRRRGFLFEVLRALAEIPQAGDDRRRSTTVITEKDLGETSQTKGLDWKSESPKSVLKGYKEASSGFQVFQVNANMRMG